MSKQILSYSFVNKFVFSVIFNSFCPYNSHYQTRNQKTVIAKAEKISIRYKITLEIEIGEIIFIYLLIYLNDGEFKDRVEQVIVYENMIIAFIDKYQIC